MTFVGGLPRHRAVYKLKNVDVCLSLSYLGYVSSMSTFYAHRGADGWSHLKYEHGYSETFLGYRKPLRERIVNWGYVTDSVICWHECADFAL
jgi:hypothetical protein